MDKMDIIKHRVPCETKQTQFYRSDGWRNLISKISSIEDLRCWATSNFHSEISKILFVFIKVHRNYLNIYRNIVFCVCRSILKMLLFLKTKTSSLRAFYEDNKACSSSINNIKTMKKQIENGNPKTPTHQLSLAENFLWMIIRELSKSSL